MRAVLKILAVAAALWACGGEEPDSSGSSAGAPGASGTTGSGSAAGASPGAGQGGANSGSAGRASGAGTTGGAGTNAGAGTTGGGAGNAGGSASGAGTSGASGSTGGSAGDPGPTTSPFPPADINAMGPYGSTTMEGVGPNSNYTVYLPTQLAPGGAKNPIVGWMSGGGTFPALYTLLPYLASHGFVVIASNSIPGIGAEVELGAEIIAGIDWAIAENGREGGMLFGKLDTTKIASVGYSMGSLATFVIAGDQRLTTTVHISGGNMAPERIDNLHAPAAFICGIPGPASCTLVSVDCDIAAANCDIDFEGADTPVFYANFDNGHLGILTSPYMERISAMTTAWLRYQLMSDGALEPMFVGPDCTYCKDANWKVKQKNLQ